MNNIKKGRFNKLYPVYRKVCGKSYTKREFIGFILPGAIFDIEVELFDYYIVKYDNLRLQIPIHYINIINMDDIESVDLSMKIAKDYIFGYGIQEPRLGEFDFCRVDKGNIDDLGRMSINVSECYEIYHNLYLVYSDEEYVFYKRYNGDVTTSALMTLEDYFLKGNLIKADMLFPDSKKYELLSDEILQFVKIAEGPSFDLYDARVLYLGMEMDVIISVPEVFRKEFSKIQSNMKNLQYWSSLFK